MDNRTRLIEVVKAVDNLDFKQEIEWHMEVEREDAYDEADAFNDLWDDAEYQNQTGFKRRCVGIAIEVGLLVEKPTKNDIGRDTRYTHKGVKYDVSTHWDAWIYE